MNFADKVFNAASTSIGNAETAIDLILNGPAGDGVGGKNLADARTAMEIQKESMKIATGSGAGSGLLKTLQSAAEGAFQKL